MIIEDTDDTGLPSDISGAEEVILVIHHIEEDIYETVQTRIRDSRTNLSCTDPDANFRTVNGQYQPVLSMTTNAWQRWRIVWGDWEGDNLDLYIESSGNCEMALLAKDSIYIADYPRTITMATIPTGGRADIMVRCTAAGTYTVYDFEDKIVMTLEVTDGGVTAADLMDFTPNYPDYLTSLVDTEADDGCSCSTAFAGCPDGEDTCVNDLRFGE